MHQFACKGVAVLSAVAGALCVPAVAFAGPPFQSDDPVPTPDGHYEIYAFANGITARGVTTGEAGIDFNYGAAPDLQLTAVVPLAYESSGGSMSSALGNIELAAKFRFLHQDDFGVDVAFFPRVFLPSSSSLADRQASLLLPIWIGKDIDKWSTFGGGGCVLTEGGSDLQDYCLAGWALTYHAMSDLQVGAELFHQTPDTKGERASTTMGFGITYDLNENVHLLGYVADELQNASENGVVSWYASVLLTF